jgi:multiple sugar transport system permease protein
MTQRQFVLACLVPGLLLLAVLAALPTIGAINLAFQDRMLRFPDSVFVGFENFERMYGDRRFWNAIRISLYWELITVIGTMVVALLVAFYLFEKVKGRPRDVICLLLIVPILMPRVSAGLIWRFLYSPMMGVINYPITLVGLPPVEFLANPATALWAVAAVDIWQWGLFFGVVLLKLIETLPREPLEAARLDHAGPWQVHWFITLPMLKVPLVTLAFVKAVESLRSFDLIYTMTNGGPGIATETLDLYAYQQGIGTAGRISYASAMSVLLLVVTIVIFTIIWRRTQRWLD